MVSLFLNFTSSTWWSCWNCNKFRKKVRNRDFFGFFPISLQTSLSLKRMHDFITTQMCMAFFTNFVIVNDITLLYYLSLTLHCLTCLSINFRYDKRLLKNCKNTLLYCNDGSLTENKSKITIEINSYNRFFYAWHILLLMYKPWKDFI